ncbi:MAG: Ig-like domain-containing protein, partial [Gemmatimonadota bacterium]
MHLAKKLAASVLALSLTAFLPSCDAGITSPAVDHLGANPPTVRLERSELQLVAGDTARLTAQLVSASGSPLPGQGVSWSSSAPEVVSVDRDGAVSALRAGEATVTASAGQASATALVRVSSRVAVLRISPEEDTLNAVGATIALAATVLDPSGQPVPAASVVWASLDPAIAVVDAEGQVTSLGMGVARITGGSGGKTDTVRVHVKQGPASLRLRPKDPVLNAVGDTLRLQADGQDSSGRALDPAAVKWTSLSPAVATVDGVGLVTARATGTARVAAEFGGRADTVTVTVRQLVASVAVTPGAPTVQAGQAQQMVAAAKDSNGNDIPGVAFAWMSSNPAAATVSGAGVVSAVAPGVSYVTATAGSRSGTATVTVTANPGTVPARVAIEPEAGTLDALGASAQLGATVYSAAGGAMAGVATSWSSLDAGVATVDGAGRVTARAVGTARIVATAGALADTAAITVRQVVASVAVSPSAPTVQAGQSQQLTAAARDANGNDVPGVAFAWTSSNSAAATVDGSGTLRGVAAGVSYVTAAAAGRSAVATVTVTADPGTVASRVAVTPETATLDALGATAQLGATVYSAAGSAMAGAPLAWSSLDAGVASVDASGRVTARAVGAARIVATSGTLVDTATVTVRQLVASIAVTPGAPVVQEGGTQQMSAAASDANGNAVPTAAFAWTSSNPAAATVDAAGVVRAVAAGVSYVTASAGGKTATATVTVDAAAPVQAPVASVSVAPGSAALVVGGSVLVTASARDAAGNVLTGRAVTWSSSSPAVATVSASGMVTGAAVGSATITATVEGKTGTATVTVSADPATTPARIAVTPGSDTLGALGAATQLRATVYSASGAAMSGTSVSWTSLNAGVATTDAAGRVTAVAAGTARIVAAAGSLADTATVVVRQVVASVAVSPSAPVVQEGATQQVAATAKDANGNAIAGAAFTWTSSNAAAATVNGSGLVSGVAAGVSYVTASAGGKSAVATVTVSAPAVATVTVSPGSASIATGGTVDLSAVARDGAGRILTGRAVTWASSNPAVATVSATGLVTGMSGGAATITATSEGKSGTAAVTVSAPAPVASSVVYAHNFNDGTIGAFGQWGGYTPKPVSIIADPTGSGRGSVAKVVYERDPAGGGSVDVNGGMYYRPNPAGGHPSGVGFGDSIYFRADLWFPRYPGGRPAKPQIDQRKLLYLKFGESTNRSSSLVL